MKRFHQDQAVPIGAPERVKPAVERARHWLLLPVVVLPTLLWWMVPPEGLSSQAWHLLLIFLATILGIILRPYPMGAVALLGLAATTVTKTVSLEQALTGFSSPQIWLVVLACFISRGFIKTGLAARIAYLFLMAFGRGPVGIGYGLVLSDLILAPAVPSNTARVGGILTPILKALSQALGSRPEDGTAKQMGSYLSLVLFQGSVVTSAMFLTALAANPIAVRLAADSGIEISWTLWAKAAILPGLISLAAIPPLIYWIYPPTKKDVVDAVIHAREKLAEMGAVRQPEWLMLVAFGTLLVLWIFGKSFGIDATMGALVGVVFLLVSGILTWRDFLAEELAWDVLMWLSVLVVLATQLTELGFISWFGSHMVSLVTGYSWPLALMLLVLIYYYSHYLFASVTAHVTAMYAPFLAVALAVGAPPLLVALLLAFSSSLFGGLTHYGTGPAPVIFGLRYVTLRAWWATGALLSLFFLLIWGGIGSLWWKWLGIW